MFFQPLRFLLPYIFKTLSAGYNDFHRATELIVSKYSIQHANSEGVTSNMRKKR